MKWLKSLLLVVIVAPNLSWAKNGLSVLEVDAGTCPSIGHAEAYVMKNCAYYQNGDIIQLHGTHYRYDLAVTNSKEDHDDYFTPLGIDNVRTMAVKHGPIQIVSKNKKRRAIIYRLDYTTKSGERGFQIITIRTVRGSLAKKKTCTVAALDSNSASLFKGKSGINKELAMREHAMRFVESSRFNRTSCMNPDHNQTSITETKSYSESASDR